MRKHLLWVVTAASLVAAALWVAPTAAAPAGATVERAVFTFNNPVRVANRILMGSYVIEHDEGRMARGEPCTRIYKGTNIRNPTLLVAEFHCVHLDRAPVAAATATVSRAVGNGEPVWLDEFQYVGTSAGHGVPR